MMIKHTFGNPELIEINKVIRQFRNRAEDAFDMIDNFADKKEVSDYIKGKDITLSKQLSFATFFKDIHGKRIPKDLAIYNNIKAFFDIYGEYDWEGVQKKIFVDKFTEYLENKKYSNNYIGRHFKVIKIVLNSAMNTYEILDTVNLNHLKAIQEEVYNIYLTDDELTAMCDLKLTGMLLDASDRFIVGAYTGLRFNDFNRLNPEKDIVDGKISIITGMVGGNKSTKVVIPVHPRVKEILERRGNTLSKGISNQKLNEYIKKVGKKAKIKSKVVKYKTVGGKLTKEDFLKCDLISSYTARRSFATNAFKAGLKPNQIMMITDHKTEKSFLKYIRLLANKIVEPMAQRAFFHMK